MSTLETLARQVVMGSFRGPELPPWAARLLEGGLGSVCAFGSNVRSPDELATLTAAMHAVRPDVLVAIDEEAGDVTRLHMTDGSPHPGNAALGAVDDLDLTERVARSIGASLAAAGIDLDLAPVVDVNSNPNNPVIGVRSFGADPGLVARHTTAFVAGLQAAGVGACAKHFPGHGDTAVDSHLALPTVDVPPETLRARELVPFRAAVEAGSVAVMSSHVLLPALDATHPATLSPTVLSMLREELGFDGLLVSDAVDMQAVARGRGEPGAAVLALAAGCDLICLGADKGEDVHLAVAAAVVDAVHDGRLPEQRLAEAAGRVHTASATVRGWREHPAPSHNDLAASDEVARRALRVDGTLPGLAGAAVLRLRTGTNAAVADAAWGLPPDGAVLAGRPVLDVQHDTAYDEVLSATGSAPVIALVREAHRHPWVLDLLHRLAAARPDLVVVEMGWPGEATLPGAAVVTTHGASRANAAALDHLLSGAS